MNNILGKLLLVCLALPVLAACGEDEDTVNKDRTAIETYLNGNTYLREFEPEVIDDAVYKIVENAGRDGYDDAAVLEKGDRVEFYYEGYVFGTSLNLAPGTANISLPFATNNPELLADLTDPEKMGDNPLWDLEYWPDDPVEATVGSTSFVKGVQRGLPGSREGDSVLLFFTYDLGYGDKLFPSIPKNSTIVFRIIIDKVTKRSS